MSERWQVMTALVLAMVLSAWGGCRPSWGRRAAVEQTKTALIGLDLVAGGYTPWAAMHMLLVVGEQGEVWMNGEPRACLEVLSSDDLHPGALLMRTPQGFEVRPSVPVFAHEMEDHHAQFWALRAQSLHDRPQAAGRERWEQCAQALLELDKSRGSSEREWLIILGGLAARNLPHGDLKASVVATTQKLLADYLRGEGATPTDVSACGGMHGAVAVQICAAMEGLGVDLRTKAQGLLEVLGSHVQRFRRADGYVEFPGLHYPFEEPASGDRIRVLGHIVEWWSYEPKAMHQDERVVRALELAVGELRSSVVSHRLHSKEIGELCHAVGALERLGR